jgi:hypothetical protein
MKRKHSTKILPRKFEPAVPGNVNFLLTEREVWTEKYRTGVFFVQTGGLYKKTKVQYFSVHTQAMLIKSLLYGIYIWNKQEMYDLKCILVTWYTFGRRKQKIQCISSFPLKTIHRYLINNKLNYSFQLVLLLCFKMHEFVCLWTGK